MAAAALDAGLTPRRPARGGCSSINGRRLAAGDRGQTTARGRRRSLKLRPSTAWSTRSWTCGADVVIADPFISSHQVTENDNNAIDMVVKEWGRVAELGNCAVRLTHHARKGEQEITAESGRGASALIAAARCVRVFNRMSKEEADKAGIEDERYR